MMIIKKRYVEIEVPDDEYEDRQECKIKKHKIKKHKIKEDTDEEYTNEEDTDGEGIPTFEKDLQIPLEKLEKDEQLIGVALRLGKMRVQDIAYELNIGIKRVKRYRKKILNILSEISELQKVIVISQEEKIEELREKILAGKIKRRRHNYSFGVEGLVRGIVRELTVQGKSIREIVEQTNLETSTVSYHRKKIKDGERRKIPPRIMNMAPDKDIEVNKLLKKNKKQRDICEILDISSATASTIVNKVKSEE